ncbi:hypothetical protein OAG24_01050 [bacterium]|nr:hypothetical protein [bacterium]
MSDYVVNKVTKKRYLKSSPKGKALIAGRKARAKASRSTTKRPATRRKTTTRKVTKRKPTKRKVTKRQTPAQKMKKWENLYDKRYACNTVGGWWNYDTNKCNKLSPSEKFSRSLETRNARYQKCNSEGKFWSDVNGRCYKRSPTQKLNSGLAKQQVKDRRRRACTNSGSWWKSDRNGCYEVGESPLDKLRGVLGTKPLLLGN